ncbi:MULTISPECIES: hypothetical protein [Mesoflavibacter]|uniref:Uncharacterized protein n=1 Tax=Mesoflavibacter zeaxanthinifaciens subsp. sabulilitoris TaxID=1520893 RepID=A0A2T1NI76_9FLAO|nr:MULTISPECIES: hypothetical protein [Mesoflavibacter]MBB3124282.1 hypothetical protein [Mesoflavibacter zeaxanthinifaciens subsp. sabulilitoris]MCP4054744.1 hypothetical protein [Mesoflavibacter sp.]PSG92615.1 hypothetical protein C7H61_04005 [Mesoflavibacter zeaxanthinifaciens subsp. sabulilitoris]UAB76683.1 hypothetical protein INR78_06720 [Mesoflavibacter sp. SCSIO 43206]|tara:strand:- start:1199 stop:1399 length:201 start_codon:yes stop_codon:yes gene_type:complete
MKIFIHILTLLAVALIIFNATQLNLDALLEGQSLIALITIIASLCAIMLLQILRISKKIEAKSKGL